MKTPEYRGRIHGALGMDLCMFLIGILLAGTMIISVDSDEKC